MILCISIYSIRMCTVAIRSRPTAVPIRPRPKFKCSNEILSISSMLSVPNVFVRPKEFGKAPPCNRCNSFPSKVTDVCWLLVKSLFLLVKFDFND